MEMEMASWFDAAASNVDHLPEAYAFLIWKMRPPFDATHKQ